METIFNNRRYGYNDSEVVMHVGIGFERINALIVGIDKFLDEFTDIGQADEIAMFVRLLGEETEALEKLIDGALTGAGIAKKTLGELGVKDASVEEGGHV